MSGAQAPMWVTILLGILAVVGTVGGAWGGQLIAGKNEMRRWQRERDRETQAHWRATRWTSYLTTLNKLEAIVAKLNHDAGLRDMPPGHEATPRSTAPINALLNEVGLLGSPATIALMEKVLYRINTIAAEVAEAQDDEKPLTHLESRIGELSEMLWYSLRGQFRVDINIIDDPSDTGQREAARAAEGVE